MKKIEDRYITRKYNILKVYDYSKYGYYYVTICTYNRVNWFGEIKNNEIHLNDYGYMVKSIYEQMPDCYPGIYLDEYIIMPNHVHGIIINDPVGAGPCTGPMELLDQNEILIDGQARGPVPTAKLSLSDIIHRFKLLTTKKYIDGVKNNGWTIFDKHLWQRSFYDHIVRTDQSLNKIREYITNNPRTWDDDKENITQTKNVWAPHM